MGIWRRTFGPANPSWEGRIGKHFLFEKLHFSFIKSDRKRDQSSITGTRGITTK